jgi:2-oxoglutarate ferredoxin oxidoreductase subunit alpha
MIELREKKVAKIADFIPDITIKAGVEKGDILVLGWGSTYGALISAVTDCYDQGLKVGFAHLRYLRPFPGNLEKLLSQYHEILIPELNNGQLIRILREEFNVNAIGINKVQGLPFTKNEIIDKIKDILKSE